MLSCCNMFLPKQHQRRLLHCWSKQHKVCHCYNELCWLGIKLSCPRERIFCSDDPNCAKWKCLAAQMTNMSHSGVYKWKPPAENLYPGFVQLLSFILSQWIREEKKHAAIMESNHASAIVFPVSHLFVWADCVFCGETSWWEWTLVNSSSHGCADCSTH